MMVKRKKVIPAKARHPTEGNENNKKIIINNELLKNNIWLITQ